MLSVSNPVASQLAAIDAQGLPAEPGDDDDGSQEVLESKADRSQSDGREVEFR